MALGLACPGAEPARALQHLLIVMTKTLMPQPCWPHLKGSRFQSCVCFRGHEGRADFQAGAVERSQAGTIRLEFSEYIFRAWRKPMS